MNGQLPITYQDIIAYCELMDESLSPWEVETIKSIDMTYLRSMHEQIEKEQQHD